ncbi:hypothetical protein DFH11DRAFT_1547679 [Phellopilus nigrolimitatus]|nr:hypothetical protein DFH11DRAFT_1547679 [Phellopilus nigrolimitatus]
MATAELRTPPLPFEITENIIQLYSGDNDGSEDSEGSEDSKATSVELLSATLSQNSHLANLVRFFNFKSNCFMDKHVRAITQIISLSSNLTHLSIDRLDGFCQEIDSRVSANLRHALTERSLTYFRLFSSMNTQNLELRHDTLCSPNKTLALLANWPDLEDFSLLDEWDGSSPDFPLDTPARCLALRRIKVRGLDVTKFLAKMAPFVEVANIHHNDVVYWDACSCLHTWSETLTHLKLYITDQDWDEWAEPKYFPFPPLRKLRYFLCDVGGMHPSLLKSMESLEELYYIAFPQMAEHLVNCFKLGTGSGVFLPALKVLHFGSAVVFLPKLDFSYRSSQDGYNESRAAWQSLEEICAQRSISFKVTRCSQYSWSD